MDSKIQTAITICGYDFAGDLPALEEALLIPGSTVTVGNTRLASFGDRVISLIIAKNAYSDGLPRGDINDSISRQANNGRLAELFNSIGLASCLQNSHHITLVSKGPASDTMEALAGAAFLSGGLDAAKKVMTNLGII